MIVLPFNEYCIYQQEHEFKLNKDYGDILVRFMINYTDEEEKYIGRKLEDIAFASYKRDMFVKKLKDLYEYVKLNNFYSEVSNIMYKVKLFHSKIINDNELYQAVETYLCCCMHLLLVDGSIKTGHFAFKNEYTQFNKILCENIHDFKKHEKKELSQLPKKLRESIMETGYNENKLVPLMYFTFLTNMFMFYDVLYKKSLIKLFTNYYDRKELMTDCFFRTHLSLTSIPESVYEVIEKGCGLDVEKVKKMVLERSDIFNNVYIRTKSGKVFLFNEVVKEGRRILFVYGKERIYGGYFIEIDLLNMDEYAVKAYAYPLDTHLTKMYGYILNRVTEVMLSYLYFSPSFKEVAEGSNIRTDTVFAEIIEQEHGSRKLNLENLELEVRFIEPILRKLPVGQKASEQAIENAKNEGFIIPEGYTFVSSFEREVYTKKNY